VVLADIDESIVVVHCIEVAMGCELPMSSSGITIYTSVLVFLINRDQFLLLQLSGLVFDMTNLTYLERCFDGS
jgi:hypothetical protein